MIPSDSFVASLEKDFPPLCTIINLNNNLKACFRYKIFLKHSREFLYFFFRRWRRDYSLPVLNYQLI